MKSFLIIILTILTFASCSTNSNDPSNNLEGFWISAYQNQNSVTGVPIEFKGVVEFSNGKSSFNTLDLYYTTIDSSAEKFIPYTFIDNNIILQVKGKFDTLSVTHFSKDSMIFDYNRSHYKNIVLKKIELPQNSVPINFSHRSFSILINNEIDTLDFLNDSVLVILNGEKPLPTLKGWQVTKINKFRFLSISNHQLDAVLIESNKGNDYYLKQFAQTNQHYELKEIKATDNDLNILGKWIETATISHGEIISSEGYPPPPGMDEIDALLQLTFDKDSIELNKYKGTRKKSWITSSNNKYLFFPDKPWSKQAYWRIIKLSKDSLIIEKNLNVYTQYETEKIIFKKIKTVGNTM